MNIHEKNLKKIIKEINKYAVIKDIRILNNTIMVSIPSPPTNPMPTKIIEVDLNKAKEFEIKFILGDEKETLDG